MICVQVPNIPLTAPELGDYLNIPNLHNLISCFLYEQENPDSEILLDDIPLADCPQFEGNIWAFPSAISIIMHPVTNLAFEGCFRRGFMQLVLGEGDWHDTTVFL